MTPDEGASRLSARQGALLRQCLDALLSWRSAAQSQRQAVEGAVPFGRVQARGVELHVHGYGGAGAECSGCGSVVQSVVPGLLRFASGVEPDGVRAWHMYRHIFRKASDITSRSTQQHLQP